MICPYCNNGTKIYNSRSVQEKTQTWRRHRCQKCLKCFTTKERIDWNGTVYVKAKSSTIPYSRERLLLSLLHASINLAPPLGALSDLTDTVERELQKQGFFSSPTQSTQTIIQVTTNVLHRYDPNMALQYVNNVYSNKPPLELIKQLVAV